MQAIDLIHTLGPAGTNCEAAARYRLKQINIAGVSAAERSVILHRTLEDAADAMMVDKNSALLTPIAYPQLGDLIYSNIGRFQIIDTFTIPTYEMVLASNCSANPKVISLHPAPTKLLGDQFEKRFVESNVIAAIDCSQNKSDGCITTHDAAIKYNLRVLKSFGRVIMGFSLHASTIGTQKSQSPRESYLSYI